MIMIRKKSLNISTMRQSTYYNTFKVLFLGGFFWGGGIGGNTFQIEAHEFQMITSIKKTVVGKSKCCKYYENKLTIASINMS